MNHASCARQHWTQITTCDQTEGRNLSTHVDLCESYVTHKISQHRLRIVTRFEFKKSNMWFVCVWYVRVVGVCVALFFEFSLTQIF